MIKSTNIKLHLISLALIAVCSSQNVTAQKDAKNSISTGFLRNITRSDETYRFLLQYERAIKNSFSFVAGFETGQYEFQSTSSINLLNNSSTILEKYTLGGNMFLLEGRYYPSTKNRVAPRGLFLGTYYKHYRLEEELIKDGESAFSKNQSINAFGVDIGYQFFNGWLMMEPVIGFGGGTHSGIGNDSRIDQSSNTFELSNYTSRIALNLGICF